MTRIATIEKADYTQIIETDDTGRTLRRLGSIRPAYDGDTARHIVNSYITRERTTIDAERDPAIAWVVSQAQ